MESNKIKSYGENCLHKSSNKRKIFELTHSLVHEVYYVARILDPQDAPKAQRRIWRNHTGRDKEDFLGEVELDI